MANQNTDSRKLTFAHSLKPIYVLSRIFGFMPFTIVFDSNGAVQTARIKAIDFIWFMASIGIYMSSSIHFMTYSLRRPIPTRRLTLSHGTRAIVIFRKCLNCLNIGIGYYFIIITSNGNIP